MSLNALKTIGVNFVVSWPLSCFSLKFLKIYIKLVIQINKTIKWTQYFYVIGIITERYYFQTWPFIRKCLLKIIIFRLCPRKRFSDFDCDVLDILSVLKSLFLILFLIFISAFKFGFVFKRKSKWKINVSELFLRIKFWFYAPIPTPKSTIKLKYSK